MAKLARSADAESDLAKLPGWIRRAAERVIVAIGSDPERMTKLFSQGARFWDGMEIEDGSACYITIYFTFSPATEVVSILGVEGRELSGPH